MRQTWQIAGILAAVLCGGTAFAADKADKADETDQPKTPEWELYDSTGFVPEPAVFPRVGQVQNGYDQFRQSPNAGHPGHAAAGHPNYDLPNKHYDVWYRPKAFGWTKALRCEKPLPWLPRGFGNLWHDPETPDRMDYHRYVVKSPRSGYGPSYYYRHPEQRCACCLSCNCQGCDGEKDGRPTE